MVRTPRRVENQRTNRVHALERMEPSNVWNPATGYSVAEIRSTERFPVYRWQGLPCTRSGPRDKKVANLPFPPQQTIPTR